MSIKPGIKTTEFWITIAVCRSSGLIQIVNTMASTETKETYASMLSDDCPSMGIYETLYKFADSYGKFMGSEGKMKNSFFGMFIPLIIFFSISFFKTIH